MKNKPAKRGAVEVERLRAIKERDQSTTEELARKVGVTQATLYGWLERGRLPGPMALGYIRRFLRRDEREQTKQ